MDLSGRIADIKIDFYTRKPLLTLQLNQEPSVIEKLIDKDLDIKLVVHRQKRSLDSNSYFHVLCDKLRQINNVSMAHQKNDLITTYGQIWYMEDGYPLTYKTNAPVEFMMEREEVHTKFIKMSEDGAYMYRVYRGSHTYNTEEMARLIEGTVMECKDAGIETASPAEIAQMQERWGIKFKEGVEA